MTEYKVSYGDSRQAKKWKNATITEEELRGRLQSTFRTTETVLEYAKLKGEPRSNAKDKGGFVGGHLEKGKRSNQTVLCRSMLTMDVDSPALNFLDEYQALCQYHTFIYTTHSHTPAMPRYRLVIFLTRDVTPDEYQAITRLYAAEWNIEIFDPCSYIPAQLMFWPTTPKDGEYLFVEVEGATLDPDAFLEAHPGWEDCSSLPTSSKESGAPSASGQKIANPLEREGVVGAFCRAFTIEEAIEKFLPDIYEAAGPSRYHYRSSSSGPGLIVFDHRFAYSNHATDPAYHKELHAFDLVRVHRFPGDEKNSFKSMAEWAVTLPEVNRILLEEKKAEAARDFTDENWEDGLTRDKQGNLTNSLHNLVLIMQNDEYMKKIVFNELADNMEVKGKVPWERRLGPFWRDADDSQLICYVDENYGSFSQRNYDIAVAKTVDDRSYHPIKEYLQGLPAWDKTPRVDTLLIDYLGAEDNEYVRAVTRKTLCAAVARIYHPGIKFDTMLVLNGDQGIGKSTLIARLGMSWFSDSLSLSDMNDKTAAEKLQGYWIMEIGELAGMRKADIDKVKAFVSRQDDKYRASFGRRVASHQRQSIFFGTTNSETGYLRDITGNRRFWNVVVPGGGKKHPWELTQDDVDQIWAEVLALHQRGEKLFLPPELEEHARREQSLAMEKDEREGVVRNYLEKLLPANWEEMDIYERRDYISEDDPTTPKGTIRRETVSNMEIWCECFGRQKADLRPTDSYTISSLMSRIEGWTRTKRVKDVPPYGRQRVYVRETE